MVFFKTFIYYFLLIKYLYAEIPNLENRDKEKIKNNIVNTYLRSMDKWDIPFQDLLDNKSGAACINWSSLTENFLQTGMFDALGYSQNIPNKKASQIAAVSGCEKMKEYYKLENTCSCEVILTNENNEVNLPVKKYDKEKEFENAILLYKNNDYKEALEKFERLSDLGDGKSQHNLAVMHYKGQGIPQNFKRSYYWLLMKFTSFYIIFITFLNFISFKYDLNISKLTEDLKVLYLTDDIGLNQESNIGVPCQSYVPCLHPQYAYHSIEQLYTKRGPAELDWELTIPNRILEDGFLHQRKYAKKNRRYKI